MAKSSEKKILVVDDEPDILNFLSACIEDAGFMVETAKDGIEALEKVAAGPPDLITLDLVMPRRSGIRVMRELREHPEWSAIPVIVITAHARDEFGREDIRALSAFAPRMRPRRTIEKPVTPEKLVQAICEILGVEAADREETAMSGLSEKEKLAKLIQRADPETLRQVKNILKKS